MKESQRVTVVSLEHRLASLSAQADVRLLNTAGFTFSPPVQTSQSQSASVAWPRASSVCPLGWVVFCPLPW